jgi:hypothetical protein
LCLLNNLYRTHLSFQIDVLHTKRKHNWILCIGALCNTTFLLKYPTCDWRLLILFFSYLRCQNFINFFLKFCKIGQNYTIKTHFFQNFPDFLVKKIGNSLQKKTLMSTISHLVNEGTHNNNFVCGFKPPPKKKKKKTIVDFYSWYRYKVAACSPKELPRIPIFAWVLKWMNSFKCFDFLFQVLWHSLSLFLADPQVQLMMELCCHPWR